MEKAKFLTLARCRYGKKFNYEISTDEINPRTRIKIICPKHGEMNILAEEHLYGYGCDDCQRDHIRRVLALID